MLVLPLKIHSRVVTKFKQASKQAFPKECFGYILGNETVDDVELVDVWVPENIEKYTTSGSINLQDFWVPQVLEYCEEHDLTPLGSIHSHPYKCSELQKARRKLPDHSTSEADALSGLTTKIHGICRVLESKTGRLTATIKFWGPELPITEEYVKDN